MVNPQLARRPTEGATTEQMYMQVIDRLPAIGAGVDDGAEAVRQPELFGHFAGDDKEMSQQRGIIILRVRQRANRSLGNDQDVRWGLSVKVTKGECQFVFVDNVRRDLSINDLLKNRHPTERPEAGNGWQHEATQGRYKVARVIASDGITPLPVPATNR